MKIVINKQTNKEVYSQIPDFEDGMGIENAIRLYGGTSEDYEEIIIEPEERMFYLYTIEELVKQYDLAITQYLDQVAQAKGYDNIISACTYAAFFNPYQNEGKAAIKWRADVWQYCYQVRDNVLNGLRPMPTIEELISELPIIDWNMIE